MGMRMRGSSGRVKRLEGLRRRCGFSGLANAAWNQRDELVVHGRKEACNSFADLIPRRTVTRLLISSSGLELGIGIVSP